MSSYPALFRELVNAYRSDNQSSIENELNRLASNSEIQENTPLFEIVLIVIQQPIVFMQLLKTLVYMQTFGQKITNTIKNQFQEITLADNAALTSENLPFVRNKKSNQNDIEAVARTYYQEMVQDYVKYSPEQIKESIETWVDIANAILGDNAGSKALRACQIAVWASGASILVSEYACRNQVGGLSNCPEITQAKNNLLNASANVNL